MQQENITLGKEKIKKPRTKQERLSAGETFVTSEKGNSMTPLIMSGQKHVLEPIKNPETISAGDIVYCKVHGRYYTHLVKAIDTTKGFLIGNNHGHLNGWTKNVYGKVIKVLKPGEKMGKHLTVDTIREFISDLMREDCEVSSFCDSDGSTYTIIMKRYAINQVIIYPKSYGALLSFVRLENGELYNKHVQVLGEEEFKKEILCWIINEGR